MVTYLKTPIDGECVDCHETDPCDPGVCLQCSPPLLTQYTVTLSGLSGSFAAFNGAHVLTAVPPPLSCYWYKDLAVSWWLRLYTPWPTPDKWKIRLHRSDFCFVEWITHSDATCLNITGAIPFSSCDARWCDDMSSCAGSPTCVIS